MQRNQVRAETQGVGCACTNTCLEVGGKKSRHAQSTEQLRTHCFDRSIVKVKIGLVAIPAKQVHQRPYSRHTVRLKLGYCAPLEPTQVSASCHLTMSDSWTPRTAVRVTHMFD